MDQTLATHVHPRRRLRMAALLALAVISGSLGAGALSLAIFTDTDAVTGGPFSTGTIVIDATPATVAFSPQPMYPGDTVTGDINVLNDGTGQFRYAMTTALDSGSAALAAALQLTVFEGTCASPGTSVYSGNLGAAFFGNPAQGVHAGDRVLNSGIDEDFCFSVELPDAVSDPALQGVNATVVFTFAAEQTANN